MKILFCALAAAISLALVLLPCASAPGSAAAAADTLAGTGWTLTSLGGQAVLSEPVVTANFGGGGALTGSAGCNQYRATYKVDGDKITIGPAASTMMACPEPIMKQEVAYLQALGQAATFKVDSAQLTLFDAGGKPLAAFAAQSSELAGTSWDVVGYNNGKQAVVGVMLGTQMTANFNAEGMLSGNAGCNEYSASYTTDGQSISIGPAASTRMMCAEPAGVMEQEAQYLAALPSAATYAIDGTKLELRTATGALAASYQRAASAAAGAAGLQPQQISLDTQGLSDSWQAVLVPATPYDASQPPGPKGLPEHIEILFGATTPADREPGTPVMYIIPVDAYRQMWDAAGNPSVSKAMDQIFKYTYVLPSPAPISGMPALPSEEIAGYNDLSVQVGRAVHDEASASKNGYRLVGRWAQDANPVTNQGLKYVYQGFTNDGKYLVAFFYPVSTSELPDTAAQVTAEQMAAFNADPTTSINESAEMLNGLPASAWDPDLEQLDALVGSLEIEGMTTSGLLDQAWTWVDIVPGGGVQPLTDASRIYQATFKSDGTMTFKIDCNTGSGTFTHDGGMVGSLRTTLGPVTLAECNDGGQGQVFMNGLMAAQDFKVRPGGAMLELVLPAGGGNLVLSNE